MASPLVQQVLGNLQYIGFYDFILPWLFAFALTYGIMKSINLFGDSAEKVRVILALSIAFFLTNYTPYGTTIGAFFSNLYGTGVFILAGMLLIVLMLGIFFGDNWKEVITKPLELILKNLGLETDGQHIAIGGLILIIGVAVLLWSANYFGLSFNIRISTDVIVTGIVLGVVILAVLFMTKKE